MGICNVHAVNLLIRKHRMTYVKLSILQREATVKIFEEQMPVIQILSAVPKR